VQGGQRIFPPPNPWKGNRTGHEQAASSSPLQSLDFDSLTAVFTEHRSNAQARGKQPDRDGRPFVLIGCRGYLSYIQVGRRAGQVPSTRRGAEAPGHVAQGACEAAPGGRLLRSVCLPLGMCTARLCPCGVRPLVYCGSDEKNACGGSGGWDVESGAELELHEAASNSEAKARAAGAAAAARWSRRKRRQRGRLPPWSPYAVNRC